MKKLVLATALLALGCATTPPNASKTAAVAPVKKEEAKPTFSETVSVSAVGDLSTHLQCPKDGAWNGLDWHKIVPMANGCVRAKDWHKVEQMGSYMGVHHYLTPWGPYYMSLAAASRKDYPRAVWMLELALKKAPNEGLFHYQAGRMHWEMDDDASALKELKMAADLNPALTDAHWVMGQIALQRNEMSDAEKYLAKALDHDSKHFPALMAMATVKGKAKNYSESENFLIQAVRVNSRSLKARMALAQVQETQLKNMASALQTYKEMRQLASRNKLDEKPSLNLDEKIKVIEQSITQLNKPQKVSVRKPATDKDKKVSQ